MHLGYWHIRCNLQQNERLYVLLAWVAGLFSSTSCTLEYKYNNVNERSTHKYCLIENNCLAD